MKHTRIWRVRFGLLALVLALGALPGACAEASAPPDSVSVSGGSNAGGRPSGGQSGAGTAGKGGAHDGGAGGAGAAAGVGGAAGSEPVGGAAGAGGDAGGGSPSGGVAGAEAGVSGGGAAGNGDNGTAGEAGASHSPARLLDAWPKEVAQGQALLIHGENLAKAVFELNGRVLPLACSDDSCRDAAKAVVFVPGDATLGTGLLNISGGLPAQGIPLHLVDAFNVDSPVAFPSQSFIPKFLSSYPPISDRWMNECNLNDDRYFFSETQKSGDFIFFSGLNNDAIHGTIALSTGLVRFTMASTEDDYVGVFSTTILPYTSRIVAFPTRAGGQLILLNCDDSKAQNLGAVCPSSNTGSASNFNAGPPACTQ